MKVNLTAPTLTFPGIEEHAPYSIVDEPQTCLIYLSSQDEKRVMYLVEIVKFCDATLEKVLNEVAFCLLEALTILLRLLEELTVFCSRPSLHFASRPQLLFALRPHCVGKENGLQILQSIDQGPFELGTTRDTLGTTPEGGVLLGPERPRTYEDLSDTEKKRYDADVRATNIVLQGLPKDIYKLINHNIEAKAIRTKRKCFLSIVLNS
ncbi:hypothetical protein Tco_1577360 [Tanacetum coccineum]